MKTARWFLALALLGLSSSIAMADSADPRMGLLGGCCSTGQISPNDPNFQFTVDAGDFTSIGETIAFSFINATGQLATAVDLTLTLLDSTPPLTFTCDPSNQYFTNCSPQAPGSTLSDGGTLLVRFFSPNNGEGGFGGIPFATDLSSPEQCDGINNCSTETPGADFAVAVTDVGGDLVNLVGTQGFHARGVLEVPEPPTVLLGLTGGVLFLFFRRR